MMRLFLFAMLSFVLISCAVISDGKPSIKQGVFGQVVWLQGNLMPSPNVPNLNSNKTVVRDVYIYELTNLKQTEGETPLFTKVNTHLIAKAKTDTNGYFQCKLKPGKYSIFTVEEEGRLFANLFEGDGSIMPFEVKANEVITVNIRINYKAFY